MLPSTQEIPKTETKLYTEKGVGICQKVDIFKGHMVCLQRGMDELASVDQRASHAL